jgi:hypothetical protein
MANWAEGHRKDPHCKPSQQDTRLQVGPLHLEFAAAALMPLALCSHFRYECTVGP